MRKSKFRKLLRKARESHWVTYIERDPYVRTDGKQWVVHEKFLGIYHKFESKTRFSSHAAAEKYVEYLYWKNIEGNLADLRKKYHKIPLPQMLVSKQWHYCRPLPASR